LIISTIYIYALLDKYPGVRVGLKGESEESAKTGSSLLQGFMMGLLGIFILLSFQFRSYLELDFLDCKYISIKFFNFSYISRQKPSSYPKYLQVQSFFESM